MKKSSEPVIDTGLYRTPIELALQADTTTKKLVSYYGRIQALKIAELIYEDIKKMQDGSTETEEKILAETKKKHIEAMTKEFKKLHKQLKEFEELGHAS